MRISYELFPILISLIIIVNGCAEKQTTDFDQANSLYWQCDFANARPLLEKAAGSDATNIEAQLLLADTYRRTGETAKAIELASNVLANDSCNTFAMTTQAACYRQIPWEAQYKDTDSTWRYLTKALACDSSDGNIWADIMVEALLREKYDMMHLSSEKMVETNFLTGPTLSFGYWLLNTLPENAVLITSGDMDTYPTHAMQDALNFRQDVIIIEKEHLGLKQYVKHLRDQLNLPLPLQDTELDSLYDAIDSYAKFVDASKAIFDGWLEIQGRGDFNRPIAIAVTVNPDYFANAKDMFQLAGPFWLIKHSMDTDTLNISLIKASIDNINPKDFIGSWTSESDRSPVRRLYTDYLANNITETALVLSHHFVDSKQYSDAIKYLNWAENFEQITIIEPKYAEEIQTLKDKIKQ